MIVSALTILSLLALVALLITAALSPLETLSWWAGWTEEEIEQGDVATEPAPTTPHSGRHYFVYLSGIASLSGRFLIPRERAFIRNLRKRYPEAVIIDDVFPYSPSGAPLLAGPRIFDRLWRLIQRMKLEGRQTMLSVLINMRNVFQVMVSADHRYGPIFNHGAANVIEAALLRGGYQRGSGAAVTIIGYSGGGQIAVGASPFLTARLDAPIDVISIGGVIASGPGMLTVRRLHHIFGDRDRIQKLGAIFFPERWALMPHSEWNVAKNHGRVVVHLMEDIAHAGVKGYFGLPKVDGVSNNERTLGVVGKILSGATPSSQT